MIKYDNPDLCPALHKESPKAVSLWTSVDFQSRF